MKNEDKTKEQLEDELKRLHTRIDESEARYKTLTESTGDIIFTLSPEGTVTSLSAAFETITGWRREQWIGKSFKSLAHPDDMPVPLHIYRRVFSADMPPPGFEMRILSKPGDFITMEFRVVPQLHDGRVAGYLGIARDITGRRRAEVALGESEERYRRLVELSPYGIFIHNLEELTFANKAAAKILGAGKPEELTGKPIQQIIHPDYWELAKEHLAMEKEGKEIPLTEEKFLKLDGTTIDVEVTAIPYAHGGKLEVHSIVRDITEKKKTESQLLLAQRMDSIGRLAGGIAHDLNNILAPIMTSLQRLQEKSTDEESRKLLGILERNTKRGAYMIKHVLLFSRGVEGERRIIRVADLISEAVTVARDNIPESIEIRTDIPENIWTVTGDAAQLHHVLMNLCMNARDAMPDGGILGISAENSSIGEDFARTNVDARTGSYVVIAVSDTGTGIPPEIMDRIFEPFFTTKEPGRGTGIGLSTSLTIVKSHGGFIDVSSEVGKGTVFKVYLPVSKAGTQGAILVVDDEAQICQITRQTLEAAGYSVLTASNGAEAVSIYSQHRKEIKAVLMDMMMPVMDGPACIWVLRKINPDVRIIAVSGMTGDDRFADLTGTVHAFLKKPYTAETLLDTIREVISR